MKTKILIVDNLQRVRHGLKTILELENDFQVVGEAGSGIEAIQLAETLNPDVVLMDLVLPRLDGLEATQWIKARFPKIVVVIVTIHDYSVNRERAIDAGSDAFIPKGTETKILLKTIRDLTKKPSNKTIPSAQNNI